MSRLGQSRLCMKYVVERIKEPLLAVLVALLISSFIISHTRIPTASMSPTIKPGDHLIVSLLPYYYRDPVRGEIVVFEYGGDRLIKRVIGEPGDLIDLRDGIVYINDTPLDESDYLQETGMTYPYAGTEVVFPYRVPEGYYFMMGDNRKNSKDSRVFGPISREKIFSQGGFRIYPFDQLGFINR